MFGALWRWFWWGSGSAQVRGVRVSLQGTAPPAGLYGSASPVAAAGSAAAVGVYGTAAPVALAGGANVIDLTGYA